MKTVLILLALTISVFSGDDRLGFAFHVNSSTQDGDAQKSMALAASTGVGWVRQDIGTAAINTAPGVYAIPASIQYWIDAAQSNGLKLLVTLLPGPGWWTDIYDPVGMANVAAFIAKTEGPKVAAIACFNEPQDTNNKTSYASVEGSNWESKLVTITNGVRAAVHAVSPATQVIGLGAQGGQILNMLSMGGAPDGVDYHPYSNSDGIPEGTYQPPYFSYASGTDNWVAALDAKTTAVFGKKRDRWETEFNDGGPGGTSEYPECEWLARRLMQSIANGVAHAFIYDFTDNGSLCTVNAQGSPRQAFFLVQRYCKILSGVSASTDKIVVTSSDPNFRFGSVFSYVFQGGNKTVAAIWFYNGSPNYVSDSVSQLGTISFPVPHGFSNPQIINSVTGETKSVFAFPWTHNNGVLMVFNVPISPIPQILVIQ